MYNHEKGKCDCFQCQAEKDGVSPEEALANFKAWEAEKLARFGWIVHYVGDDSDSPTGVNIHTHGIMESYDHLDLQIVMPLPQNVAHPILGIIVDRIKNGEKFGDGDVLEQVIGGGFTLKVVAATECNRDVLRIIFPDQSGDCDVWSMSEPYRRQYGDIVELPDVEKPKRKNWTPYKGKKSE